MNLFMNNVALSTHHISKKELILFSAHAFSSFSYYFTSVYP
ncbi:hypothetical protein HMPREF9370_0171 [Neisseria wadsworthii 9715]|uniref:Uncharacterized protein n=1 Tax=Neisseria wadsworthii 9715 TaxID=1030841 RepID=G4CM62_9NEIS|nr:hypothetical protein HMPREF9370_0171 [Neisseria wadsworthii 9715]